MKYVNRVKGRDGVERLYFRRKGDPSIRLTHAWGTPELQAEVEALLQSLTPARPLPGTLRAALRQYELESAEFHGLADSTKYEYRLILGELEEDFGALPAAAFKPAYLLRLRDAWAKRGHRAANIRLQVLKNVLRPCVIAGMIDGGDPFTLIQQVRRPHDAAEPHLIWPEAVVQAVIAAAKAEKRYGLARAVAIGRWTGARRSDIVQLTTAARDAGRFRWRSGKRKVPVDIVEEPDLAAVLDSTPKARDSLVLAYNMDGRAYSEDGLALELRKLVRRLKATGVISDDRYDLHGLRHTRGVELARAGCTDAQGAAMLGHRSPHSFAPYRRQAERVGLADDAAAKVRALRSRSGR